MVVGLESIVKIQSERVACDDTVQLRSHDNIRGCLNELLMDSKCLNSYMVFDSGDCKCFTSEASCPNTGTSTLYDVQIERNVAKVIRCSTIIGIGMHPHFDLILTGKWMTYVLVYS